MATRKSSKSRDRALLDVRGRDADVHAFVELLNTRDLTLQDAIAAVRSFDTQRVSDPHQAGGLAALAALREVGVLAEDPPTGEETMDGWFDRRDRAIMAMVRAADGGPQHLRGFLEAVGEYAWLAGVAGLPDLDHWKPEAAMTPEDAAAARAKFAAECDDEAAHAG